VQTGHKAVNMVNQLPLKEAERANWDFFLSIPDIDRSRVNHNTVKGTQLLEPLFESPALAPAARDAVSELLTQLFGDRMVVANATGCSSIYGGSLPTTPWTTNSKAAVRHGRILSLKIMQSLVWGSNLH